MFIRPLLKSIVFTGAALWITVYLAGGGITFAHGWETFALATVALSLAHHVVKPFLNLLLLPINLITLGLFRWFTNVLLLYIVTLVVPGFAVHVFNFVGFSWQGIIIPPLHFVGITALLAVSFSLSFISSFLFWLAK